MINKVQRALIRLTLNRLTSQPRNKLSLDRLHPWCVFAVQVTRKQLNIYFSSVQSLQQNVIGTYFCDSIDILDGFQDIENLVEFLIVLGLSLIHI